MMNHIGFRLILLLVMALGFVGCEKEDTSAPHTVHYDRDMCSECKMVISDRNYAVQIVDAQNNKAYMFDDIGCALVWSRANTKEWPITPYIYVADQLSTKFINARTAFWTKGHRTPMEFGFAAFEKKPQADFYSFPEMREEALNSKNAPQQDVMKCGAEMKCGAGKCGGAK